MQRELDAKQDRKNEELGENGEREQAGKPLLISMCSPPILTEPKLLDFHHSSSVSKC